MICQTIGPMRNFGSSSVPVTGTSRSITPLTSFSSDVANLSGSGTASLLSAVASPHSSWSMRMWCFASSLRFVDR